MLYVGVFLPEAEPNERGNKPGWMEIQITPSQRMKPLSGNVAIAAAFHTLHLRNVFCMHPSATPVDCRIFQMKDHLRGVAQTEVECSVGSCSGRKGKDLGCSARPPPPKLYPWIEGNSLFIEAVELGKSCSSQTCMYQLILTETLESRY